MLWRFGLAGMQDVAHDADLGAAAARHTAHPNEQFGCGSKPMVPLGIGAPPILVYFSGD